MLMAVFLTAGLGFGQTGPGGVNANLEVWLKANAGTCITNNCPVTSWGNQAAAPFATICSGTELKTASFNFNPGIEFNAANDQIDITPQPTANDFDVFLVFKSTVNANGGGHWRDDPTLISTEYSGSPPGALADFGITLTSGKVSYWHTDSPPAASDNSLTLATTANHNTGNPAMVSAYRQAAGPVEMLVDGFSAGIGMATVGTLDALTANGLGKMELFGSANADGIGDLTGQIAEMVYCAATLAPIERSRIESYLAIKYGITKIGNYLNSSGATIYNSAVGFTNEIFGIMRDDNSVFEQRCSQSAGVTTGLALYLGTNFDAGPFPTTNTGNLNAFTVNNSSVVIGQDNQPATVTGTFNLITNSRLARLYKVVTVGNPDSLTVNFGSLFGLVAGESYSLVLSSDVTIDMTDTFIPLKENTFAAGTFRAEIDFPAGPNYFTIVKGTKFSPGGVGVGLSAWYRGDSAVNAPALPGFNVTRWNDVSGRNHHLLNSVATQATTIHRQGLINFNHYIDLPSMFRRLGTVTNDNLVGQTIFFVGNLAGAAGAINDNLMGFNGIPDRGIIMQSGSTISNPSGSNISPQWSSSGTASGSFRADGATVNPGTHQPFNSSWSLLNVKRSEPNGAQRFFLGGFDNSGTQYPNPDYFNVAEVIIYSGDRSDPSSQRRIESYLAMKYGLTLASTVTNYYASNDVPIYAMSGYGSNVTVIGRDDLSRLNQKQSKSVNSTATITLGHAGVIALDSNAKHLNTFTVDRTFLAVGDNGGKDCWTNKELNMGTRQYLRVEREWKAQKTGSIGSVLLRIGSATSLFTLPALPPGATGYVLLVDADGDFSVGAPPLAYPLTTNGSFLEITLTDAQLPGTTNYFTIGTALPSSYKTLKPCVGDTVQLAGYDLINDNVCILFGGVPAFGPIDLAAAPAPNKFTLVTDNPLGCLDYVSWIVPPTFSGNHYLTVTPNCGALPDNRLLNDSLWLGLPLVPMISVAGLDTVYLCVGDANVSLQNLGATGGSLSLFTYPSGPLVPIASLLNVTEFNTFNVTDIRVHAGNIGHHRLRYNYASGCSSTDEVHVYIGSPTVATLTYPVTSACDRNPANIPATTVPNAATFGGTFSSTAPGMTLNPTTGGIVASTSTPGSYLVIYTPEDSTCAQPQTAQMVIQTSVQTGFTYPDSLCQDASPVLPTLTSYTPGTFSLSAATGATINSTTGLLGFNSSALPTAYTVYFYPTAACRDTTTFNVSAITPMLPTLAAIPTACALTPSVPLSGTPAGGTFSTNSPFLSLGASSINVSASQPGGPYQVTYTTTDANGCIGSDTESFTILNLVTPVADYPRGGYCRNEGLQVPILGASMTSAGVFTATPISPIGAVLNISPSGTINPLASQVGTYQIWFNYTNSACNTPFPVDVVEIAPVPIADFRVDSLACLSANSLLLTGVNGGTIGALQLFTNGQPMPLGTTYFTAGPDQVNFATPSDTLDSNTTYFIRNIYTNLIGCMDTAFDHFTLRADQNANFGYINDLYCANTSNPTPFIYGVGGGIFSSSPALNQGQLDPATGTLFLDSAFVDINQNQVDTFFVTYTTPGPCPSSHIDTVSVREGFDSYFQFPVSVTCSDVGTVTPIDVATLNPFVSRFFQSLVIPGTNTPIGPQVNMDPVTGVITGLAQLGIDPGADTTLYIIHETGAAGFCIERTIQRLLVSRYDTTFAISYVPNIVCGDRVLIPVITGDTSEAFMNNPVGVTYAGNGLGRVDGRFSQPGLHTIVMSNRGVCGERSSTSLTILGTPDASFDYNSPSACTDDSTFVPLPLNTPGGTFSYRNVQPLDDLVLNTSTGVVTLAGSDPGDYWVIYTAVSPQNCIARDSQYISISVSPQIDSLTAEPSFSACVGDEILFKCQSQGGSVTWYLDSLSRGVGPTISLGNLVNGQVIKAILRSTAGCVDSLSEQIEILPSPTVTIVDRPSVVTENDPFVIQLQADQNSTVVFWAASALGLEIDVDTGRTPLLNSGDLTSITNGITLQSDYDPGEIIYIFKPVTNGCRGQDLEVRIEVNPNDQKVFIPEVMTPDGNGKNDVWEIRYDSDLQANDYYIEVFNRSGGLVRTIEDLDVRWDAGNAPDGVYWWLLKKRDGTIERGGGLTIRRN
jgi:gliding motility-associated-like protein